jgi:hypothetical protein
VESWWSWGRGKSLRGKLQELSLWVVGKAVLTLHPPLRPLSHNVNPRDGAQDMHGVSLCSVEPWSVRRTRSVLCVAASVRGRLERPGLINANKRRWHMMCSGAALPSAHSTTARSGTCASARASDTHTYKGTSQHTPDGLLLLRTDDQQTDTDCDTLNCARASARAPRGAPEEGAPPR